MRSTQFIGHTNSVKSFLSFCKKGEYISTVEGMFDEEVYDLHYYTDNNGIVWEEFVLASPWSSGPMIFLGIKNKNNLVMGWKLDRNTKGEVDWEKETYFV